MLQELLLAVINQAANETATNLFDTVHPTDREAAQPEVVEDVNRKAEVYWATRDFRDQYLCYIGEKPSGD